MTQVDELLARLEAAYEAVKFFPENDENGFIKLLQLRNLAPEAATLIRSLVAERDELLENEKPFGDWQKEASRAYNAEQRATAAEAENAVLQEALQPFADFAKNIATISSAWDEDDFVVFLGDHTLKLKPFRRARLAVGI